MTTYVVNPPAHTNGSGSLIDPKNTRVGLSLSPGDVVLQIADTTAREDYTAGASGTASDKIIHGVCEAQTGTRITDGSRRAAIVGVASHGFNIGTRAHITLELLDITAADGAFNAVNGLAAAATTDHYITIDRCRLSAPGQNGAQLRGKGDQILDTEIFRCAQDALFLTVSDCTIDGLYAYDNDSDLSAGDGIQFSGTHDHGVCVIQNSIIIHPISSQKQCVITGGGTGTFKILKNIMTGGATVISMATPNAIIEKNRISNASVRALTFGATGIRMIGNLVHDCPDGVIFDEAYAAYFYNNTFADIVADCIRHAYTGGSYTAKNNVFLRATNAHNGVAGVSVTSGANSYYETTDYNTVTETVENAEIYTDPLLDAEFRLRAGSPCIGAGTQITGEVLRDFDGKVWDGAVDIGARMYHAPRARAAGREISVGRTAALGRTRATNR